MEREPIFKYESLEERGQSFTSTSVPIYLYDEHGSEFFSLNQTLEIEKTTVGVFKKMNFETQGEIIVPERYRKLGGYPVRRFQKRRRRRLNRAEDEE